MGNGGSGKKLLVVRAMNLKKFKELYGILDSPHVVTDRQETEVVKVRLKASGRI